MIKTDQYVNMEIEKAFDHLMTDIETNLNSQIARKVVLEDSKEDNSVTFLVITKKYDLVKVKIDLESKLSGMGIQINAVSLK